PHSRDLTPTRGLPPTGLASAGLPALALSSPLTPTPLSGRRHPMLEIPRSLARQFRAVLRRALAAQESRGSWPLVLCQADGHGLTLQARQGDVAVRYHLPGERAAEALAFRASAFAEFEGSTPDPVSLESVASDRRHARWEKGGESRELELETVTPDSVPPFPELPERFAPLPDSFLRAFQEACVTAA